MPRIMRFPEGALRRGMLAASMAFPFVLYVILRVFPMTSQNIFLFEARIARAVTRVTYAVDYLFRSEAFENDALLICREEKRELAENFAQTIYRVPERTFPVHVIARAYGGDPEHILVVKEGGEPFEVGEYVVQQGVFLGVVMREDGQHAVVQALTHPKMAIPAMIAGKEEVVGVIKGTGGAWVQFAYVPKGSAVVPGDLVLTSGLGQSVPRGLLLGTVREVQDEDSSPFYRVDVEPIIYSHAWWDAEIFDMPVL